MTPAQQAALEALAERALSPGEIALAAIRNDADLAASLSVGRTRIASRLIGRGTILAVMAPGGGLFLAALRDIGAIQPRTEDTANVAEAVGLIDQGCFDIGMDATREQMQRFAASKPELEPGISALLDLARVNAPIQPADVSAILNSET